MEVKRGNFEKEQSLLNYRISCQQIQICNLSFFLKIDNFLVEQNTYKMIYTHVVV